MWVTLGSEAILAMRTYAFLGCKRWIAVLLTAMLVGECAFLLYVSIGGVHQTVVPVVTKGPCTATDAPGKHVVSGYWLAPVAFDLFCTFLTLWKVTTLQTWKSRLVKIFVGEGLFYFLLVSAVNVLNAIFMFQSNANIQNINSFLALILTQVLCCRLVLNLRAQAQSSFRGTDVPSTKGPTIPAFARPVNPTTITTNTVNIPLERFERDDSRGAGSDGERGWDESSWVDHGGVKVRVEVERDVEVGR
ncbi:hypothetical protein BN946_scf184808.g2 [Trametes cinnabarina]|uniref:Uncharacterized protein n=1 Tax=Pycnoporus cinnabarinus TaxID=5643 RepID=A0A060SM05_PYCCI|nr:hypothetical protein BN946_scf184808.g2 [Trametes cinnabarina]